MEPQRWQQIKTIAADAMELDGEARAAYLDRACAADDQVRREVEALLEAHDESDSLIDAHTDRTGRRTIGPALSWTRSPRPRGARPETQQLPAELLERGARRLGTLALMYAAGFLLGYGFYEFAVHILGASVYEQAPHTIGQVVVALFVAVSLAVYYVASRRKLPPLRLVHVGLVFEVVGSLGIAIVSYSGPWARENPIWGISWICVWIMICPLVIPSPPRLAAMAAFASAAMGPLAIVLWAVSPGRSFPPVSEFVGTTAPNFICAIVAWLGATYIYRIGLALGEAKQLGSYRLVSRIGRGGMGEVWIAEHDMLARPAALKLVRPDLMARADTSTGAAVRFEQEAQSTAALSSPHTVTLYDFGLTEEGVFYYVMELLDGLDLETLVRRHGPVPPNRTIHFMRQICASLSEAHALDLVHRDIKPLNILVCRQGLDDDFVKVLDFGIVKHRTDLPGSDPEARSGLRIEGSPDFMAPEAANGVSNPRTDLYSLGCVGYWLLTGHSVFDAESPLDAVRKHRTEQPIPPSRRAGIAIPPALEALILACLDKNPEMRPQSAEALAARLDAIEVPPWDHACAKQWWVAHSGDASRA